jgi:hypothetical protein
MSVREPQVRGTSTDAERRGLARAERRRYRRAGCAAAEAAAAVQAGGPLDEDARIACAAAQFAHDHAAAPMIANERLCGRDAEIGAGRE